MRVALVLRSEGFCWGWDGGGTDFETFFQIVRGARLGGEVATVGVVVGRLEGLFGDGQF